ncbi:MAG: DUF2975 domain-containing protein [Clostridia bacterium]|nr:DUF2975 domain-containing protein [Clostridia bacterium]
MKKESVWLLIAGAAAGIGVLFVAFVYVPAVAGECRETYPEYAALYWPGLASAWAIAGLFLLGLWEYFRVCFRIGRDRSFCMENVKSLRRITAYMAAMAGLFLMAIFAPGLLFRLAIGPAWLMLLLCAMASAALALLAYGLSRLLRRAVEIKEENDLTV